MADLRPPHDEPGKAPDPALVIAALESNGTTYRYLTELDRTAKVLLPSAAARDLTTSPAEGVGRPRTSVPVPGAA